MRVSVTSSPVVELWTSARKVSAQSGHNSSYRDLMARMDYDAD